MPIDRTATYAPTVTGRIQRRHLHYGGSDYTAQHATASGKSLNYANGPTLTRPEHMTVYAMPMIDKWEDAVGLFGAENKFVKYTYSDKEIIAASCFEDIGYECAAYHPFKPEKDEGYKSMKWDPRDWVEDVDYEQALWLAQNEIPDYDTEEKFISVEIVNHGTGNIYNDDWLDVRLYAKDRIEHPYSKMYVPWKEPFYAGFHARNTRRLPYDVDIVIGAEILPLSKIKDKRLIRRTIEFGTQY